MKQTLLLSILLYHFTSMAQGPQQLVDVPYDKTWPGATVKGWLYLPADYATSSTNYPVVFFYHGIGEAGTNPYTLLNQGVPNLIANGMRPDNVTNPVDGKKYSFIVLSVQHSWWSPDPNWLPVELAWLQRNYRIDTTRVYVTGLSAGGEASYSSTIINEDVSHLIAAAAPMSPAQVSPYDPSLIGQNKIKTWFFSGDADPSYTANATSYFNDCNNLYPNSSKLNIFSGGHCCWNTFYTPTWHDATTGLSIWEWMLTNQRVVEQTPLPVKFISFDLKKESTGVQLSWKVGSEEKVSSYEIEESNDARTFIKIGEVKASAQNEYSFTDRQSPANFYRIKSVDADGKSNYSTILKYNGSKASVLLKAFPSIVHSELNIQHPTAVAAKITIGTTDGRSAKVLVPEPGTQQITVDLSGLQAGLYFVKYEDVNGIIETTKIVKQ